VLEAANNHWGDINRGLKIVRDYGQVVRHHNVRAAIKFQFRDVSNFIHKDFRGRDDLRYISKTERTKLPEEDFETLAREVVAVGCIPMATPFDEKSVDLCENLEFPIIKVASSDINAWPLLERIALTKKPVIVSTGGASIKAIDDVVTFFENRGIPLAINHCVSLYPSEDTDLELNQIDFLKKRYPSNVIGFSSHEYQSWDASMFISYAKGARTWERHVDIDFQGVPVSPYCSLPENIDKWFSSFKLAKQMCGGTTETRRVIPRAEEVYLDALMRGIYTKTEIGPGTVITKNNFDALFYLAIPLQKGQLSVQEVITGLEVSRSLSPDEPLMVGDVLGSLSENTALLNRIKNRGL
jgi:N-acetylneuraminate synthase